MNLSQPVSSMQTAPHARLEETVLKHSRTPWRKPVAEHSRRGFDAVAGTVNRWQGGLVLDTGCGTGRSTAVLAERHPDCLVIGVDKSASRLSRAPAPPPNALLVRADLEDFWLLAHEAGWKFVKQCVFYPNPWPKPEHRLRRWPFHPVFPSALACGGVWELRTNWKIYADEFALAFKIWGVEAAVTPWSPSVADTPFEAKYLASGHSLWRFEAASPQNRPKG